ncbi:MAG TPA: sugar ABC transporter substrate-binding protein [Mycobacteriales bacterium]|nr:sugar ABC transporter substrate-binding protein [Mycobacteriales bacterium]
MSSSARPLPAALAAVVLGAVTLAGCGDGTPAASGPKVIGFAVANTQLNFAREMMDGFRAGVAQVDGVRQVTTGPPSTDSPHELELFNKLVDQTSDGVAVFTLAAPLFAPALQAAGKRGMPVLAVDNPPGPGSGVKLFIGNDNYRLGQLLADQAIAGLPAGRGTVVIGNNAPGVPVLDLRARGIRDEFAKRRPDLQVLGPFDTKQDVPANLVAWTGLVRANPQALAFLGTGDADGWHLAAIRARVHGRWLAGAFDLDPRSLQAVRAGQLLLVSPEHYVKGAVAGRLLADAATGRSALPQGWLETPGLVVDKSNVASIIARQVSYQARGAWFRAEIDQIIADPDGHLRPLAEAG